MKKTRVLASLLCLMMILSVIPMMQVAAAENGTTKTEAALMEGFGSTTVGGQNFSSADDLGKQTRTQIADFDYTVAGSTETTNFDTLYPVTLTEETPTAEDSDGKYLRYIGHTVAANHPTWTGNAERTAQVNFWPTTDAGDHGFKYGSEGYESYLLKYRFRLYGTGSVNIQNKAKSKINFTIANGSDFKPFDVSVATGAEGTWHEVIVVVDNAQSTTKTFTYWYSNNNNDTYTYAGSDDVDDGSEQDGQLTFTVPAETTMELDHILMYGKAGKTKAEVMGNNAVILNSVQYDAEMNDLLEEVNINNTETNYAKINTACGSGSSGKGSAAWYGGDLGCINVQSTGEYRINWPIGTNKYLLGNNMAVEVAFKPNANGCILTARLDGGETCVYLKMNKDGSIQTWNGVTYTEVWTKDDTSTSEENSMLIVYRNSKLELYKKLAGEQYKPMANFDPSPVSVTVPAEDGSDAEPTVTEVLTGNQKSYSMLFKGTGEGSSGYYIYGVTRYALGVGVAGSDTLTNASATLSPYVEEDFTNLNQASYTTAATYSEGNEGKAGSVTAGTATDGSKALVINTCSTGGGGQTSFTASNAGIPKGGYADLQFKMQGHLQWLFADGETAISLYTKHAYETTSYTINDGTVDVPEVSFAPNRWYDLRVVRGTNGNYSTYVKEAGESVWFTLFEDKAGYTSNDNMIMVHNKNWVAGFPSDNVTTKQYVRNLAVYGPLSKTMTVLDGAKTTLAPEVGATLKYGARVVLQPAESSRTLIFAGYDDEKNLVAAEPVTVPADNDGKAEVVFPSTLDNSKIEDIKVFLWDGFDNMNVVAPMQSFAK